VDAVSDQSSAAADRLQTPTSLAWDGTNLFVSDTYNMRVLIYSPADPDIPPQGVLNAASLQVFAIGGVALGGTINAGDIATITIQGTAYNYTVVKNDTFDNVVNALVKAINTSNSGAGDPNVVAEPNLGTESVVLTAKKSGINGNSITLAASVSSGAKITATASGVNLGGGQDSAQIGPGTLVSIFGTKLADTTASAPATGKFLPNEIAGARVYVDGARVPMLFASPTQINAQIPINVNDATSVSLYVQTHHTDGTITATTPVSITIVPENPGIFATGKNEPRAAIVYHGTAHASGSVSVDGTVKAGDVGTIKIQDRTYNYTVQSTDTLATIRDALIAAVNKDPKVTASAAGVFTRVQLQAKATGKAGNGITYSASVNTGATLLLSPSGSALCCANTGLATKQNPAIPGEVITIYATGLGLVTSPMTDFGTGRRYDGPVNQPLDFVSSLAGGKTANVLKASPLPGSVGVFEVDLELNADLPTDYFTQVTIAQSIFVSNVATIPVRKP
jgi:uncharacterized protein (TIGR03437 family)